MHRQAVMTLATTFPCSTKQACPSKKSTSPLPSAHAKPHALRRRLTVYRPPHPFHLQAAPQAPLAPCPVPPAAACAL